MNIGEIQGRFGQVSRSDNGSIFSGVEIKVEKDGNRDFRPVRNLRTGKVDCNQFTRKRKPLVVAAKNLCKGKSLSLVHRPKFSKDIDEQPRLSHKMLGVVHQPNRNLCISLFWYDVQPKNSYVNGKFFQKLKEESFFQQLIYRKQLYLLNIIIFVFDKMIASYFFLPSFKKVFDFLLFIFYTFLRFFLSFSTLLQLT